MKNHRNALATFEELMETKRC